MASSAKNDLDAGLEKLNHTLESERQKWARESDSLNGKLSRLTQDKVDLQVEVGMSRFIKHILIAN